MRIRKKTLFILLGMAFIAFNIEIVHAQSKYSITGTVYEMIEGKKNPLPAATIFIEKFGLGTMSQNDGRYFINNISEGEFILSIQFIGKVPIDTLIQLKSDLELDFTLKDDNFRLEEVVVTAKQSTGQSTSSTISNKAIEHLQSVSLDNIMALLPGGISSNPNLNYASQINIRNISSGSRGQDFNTLGSALIQENNIQNFNALGSAIIQDGTPLSNNVNLQTMNPSVKGSMRALGGTASPAGGIDTRGISLENIESVEVIRGVPSVEYGDLTAGAVIIKSKAGRTPLKVKARTNPNVYQFFAQKGITLGEKSGALNLSADYAYNVNNPIESYRHYQRYVSKVFYSNSFLNEKWKSNTIFDFMHEKNNRDRNPDDKITETVSEGKDVKISLNTNGTIYINKGWLKNIKYIVSGRYSNKHSHYEQLHTAANAPYSMTTIDGAIITNKPGLDITDVNGTKLTNYRNVNPSDYAVYLPSTYKGIYDIDGKEISLFTKISATLFKRWNKIDNRILLGGEFRTEGNMGDGKTFDKTAPPYRNLQALNASFRPRPYDDIPFIRHGAIFLEDNFTVNLTSQNTLRIQGGLRYDMMKNVESTLSPRINASIEILPKRLFLRGAYGVTAKMPTLVYLYPEKAYFEYININEIPNDKIAEKERILMTTTRVFDVDNKNLKVATNKKYEVGIDIKLDKAQLYITAFKENLKNGYSMSPTFKPFTFNEYKRMGDGSKPIYELSASNPVLAEYYTPSNNLVSNTEGIEFDLNINRINAIRTAFSFSGAFMRNESYSNDFTYYDKGGEGGASRTHIGLYGPEMSKRRLQRFSTALRATHNIPEIGFVITLTAETVWNEKSSYKFGNDTIPAYYISKNDGMRYQFDPTKKDEPEFKAILRKREDSKYITESYPPLFNFNINLTKEINNFMRVSFFANNMFRSYPIVASKRSPGSFYKRNKKFFFGIEVNLLIN